jgi:hypothetical protein
MRLQMRLSERTTLSGGWQMARCPHSIPSIAAGLRRAASGYELVSYLSEPVAEAARTF